MYQHDINVWYFYLAALVAILFISAILAIAAEAPDVKHPMNDKWE